VASRRLIPVAKSNGATVADQYDTAGNWGTNFSPMRWFFDATAQPLREQAFCKVGDFEGAVITFCFFGCAQLYFAAL